MNYLDPELRELLSETAMFEQLANMDGEVFREVASRRTFRFRHGERDYFAKVHYGVGWREIIKNLVQMRLPVLGAENEWIAIRRLDDLGVDTMVPVAYSRSGANPATLKSCIVTRALVNTVSLEDLAAGEPIPHGLKRRLVSKVAAISARMHEGGVNHRDLYICHFHLDMATRDLVSPKLHVIDLHRAQVRRKTPRRWIVKDVAGLLFSAFDAGLTRTDLARFMKAYSGKPLRTTLREDEQFWRRVVERARRLYQQEFGRPHEDAWPW